MIYYAFLFPLIIASSLVYAASRHESWPKILGLALRFFGAVFGILLITTVLLLLINTQV